MVNYALTIIYTSKILNQNAYLKIEENTLRQRHFVVKFNNCVSFLM